MELHDYARILRRNWALLVVFALLGVGAAALYCLLVTPKFESSTVLYVSVRTSDRTASGDLAQGSTFARQAVTSYVDVASSARVLDRVIADLKLGTSSAELSRSVKATSPQDSVLIQVTASNRDPRMAAMIANSTGRNLI